MINILFFDLHEGNNFDLNEITQHHQFHFKEDKNRHIAGRILITEMLKIEASSLTLENLKFSRYGKPYFENFLYFNISHSKNIVILCYSLHKTGIDIEFITDELPKISYEHFFHPNEKKYILQNSEENVSSRFFELWTKKEAVVKAHGIGMNSRLPQLNTLTEPYTEFDNMTFFTKKIQFFKNYACHIASTQKIGNISMRKIEK